MPVLPVCFADCWAAAVLYRIVSLLPFLFSPLPFPLSLLLPVLYFLLLIIKNIEYFLPLSGKLILLTDLFLLSFSLSLSLSPN